MHHYFTKRFFVQNINFENFYTTKKLYTNDFEYTFGLLKAMFEDFKIRNSLVGPAFFDHIYNLGDDYGQFWTDFNTGCNRASIFNPVTYRGILDEIFTGETVFGNPAPSLKYPFPPSLALKAVNEPVKLVRRFESKALAWKATLPDGA